MYLTRTPSLYQRAKLIGTEVPPEPIILTFDFGVRVDVDRFRAAIWQLAAEHEALRSSFFHDGTKWAVRVADIEQFQLEIECCRVCEGTDAVEEVQLAAARSVNPCGGSVIAAGVARVGIFAPRDVCWLAVDHLVIDGESVGILAAELAAAYWHTASSAGSGSRLEYYDFGDAHTEWAGANLPGIVDQWEKVTASGSLYPEVLSAYLTGSRPQGHRTAREATLAVRSVALSNLESTTVRNGVSPYVAQAGAFLSAYTTVAAETNRNVSFLTPVGYRSWPKTEAVIGYFTTLGLVDARVGAPDDYRWRAELARDVLLATERSVLPFNLLVSLLTKNDGATDARLDDLTRLTPSFPTWPTVIFDVQRNPFSALSFEPPASTDNTGADDLTVTRLEQPLVGPALLATVTVQEQGSSTISVTFTDDVSESLVRQLLSAWRDTINDLGRG